MSPSTINKYWPHIRRTITSLGAILLVAVTVGLLAELWLQTAGAPADRPSVPTFVDTLALGLASCRVALPVVGALVAIPLLASSLLHKLYDIDSLDETHTLLNRLAFGKFGRYPLIVIKEGSIAFGKSSPAVRVGGPATFVIYDDTAIVTEQYGRIKRVLGPGIHNAERFEKVWQAIDLRPQRWVFPVQAMTKEGIPVCCQAELSFQIDDRPGESGWKVHKDGLNPFSEEAVFKAATNAWVRDPEHPEHVRTWIGRVVIGYAEGLLRDILAEYRLDWLIAPPQADQMHPREEIRLRFEEGLRTRVGNVGARMLSVGIGDIEIKAREAETTEKLAEIIPKQWIEAWHADWKRRALVTRAEGEAVLLRMDMARIQAQAEMVVTLTEALQSTIMSQGTVEPYILSLRFVEALRWMSYSTINRELMPPEAMLTLKRLQEVIGPKDGGEKAQKSEGKKPSQEGR